MFKLFCNRPLGGIILEGDPGIGKSQFAIDSLIANKFREVSFSDPKSHTGDIFYKIPASMSTSNKQKLLLKAFNEGAVVIMDEMNSSPMMENLLNALLMGYDLNNKTPKRAGFIIISTQNPISMEGRSATSTALERRLFKIELPQYSNNEMEAILVNRGLNAERAALEVKEYTTVRNYGIEHNTEPLPSFRQLLQKAKFILKAQARHMQHDIQFSNPVTVHFGPAAMLPSSSSR